MVLICAPSSGQRLNDTSLKQGAWDVLNSNTVGVWPPVTQIANLATNDAGQLSLNEYAVLAIAPELAPNSVAPNPADWDRSTLRSIAATVQLLRLSLKEDRNGSRGYSDG
ncbi:hypothetical protein PHLCEN_2v11271 [Hermanssonia centrifuga]|uniref:Uncharacterized protein n=1 Tax=Hermanssonia centrifuga TaxID=98765 RepID=A0A2R6NKT9_9APHY|nr:hypothetical protein PHLCEN_2v11271 [Hermanssonia centrifuga]